MKQLDKLKLKVKNKFQQNKRILGFMILLFVIGIIAGTLFITITSKTDQNYVKEYMTSYITQIQNGELNYLNCFKDSFLSNIILFIFIFLLGISVIGIPIIVFIYFFKSFILGFSITSFILSFKLKGILYVLIYLISTTLIYILLTILTLYALKISIYLIYSVFNKLEVDFKIIMNQYFKVFIFSIIGIIVFSILETFVMPYLMSLL